MLEKIGLPAKPSLRGNNWVVDATHCQGCSSQFTFINRKHHCRRCGGLFCNSCTQGRMILRGQGDSPVRICEPCKKLEEAARFEKRYGHRSRAGRGSSKLMSNDEDEILSQILGGQQSNTDRTSSSGSSSTAHEVASLDGGREVHQSHHVEVPVSVIGELSPTRPQELRQQALEERKRYKILREEGKPEEALKAFKRGKELERQADALEISMRKNRRKVSTSNNTADIENGDGSKGSSQKGKLISQVGKEKDDLMSELRELGWSGTDLHDNDKKPANMSLEGELSSLLGGISEGTDKKVGTSAIDNTQVVAHKRKALALKREGKLAEAKEELKKAKILEKQLEEQELLGAFEDSDDEISALIKSMDDDKEDELDGYEQQHGFEYDHLMDDGGLDDNFEVTDADLEDPEIAATLKSLGWADDPDDLKNIVAEHLPVDRKALVNEIHSLKKEALNKKRAGNISQAMELLKNAKLLERKLDSMKDDVTSVVGQNYIPPEKESISQPMNAQNDQDTSYTPKNRMMIQKELLALKKSALALRREGRLDEAEEELKKGKVLEQQLEEMDNTSKGKAKQVTITNTTPDLAYKQPNISGIAPIREEEDDVTDQDLHNPAYLSLLRNLGWKDEDNEHVDPLVDIAKENDSRQNAMASAVQATSNTPARTSKRSKVGIQRELLGLKRKALAMRREGKSDEAEEVLRSAKELEAQLAEMEAPKKEIHNESKILEDAMEGEDADDVTEKDMHDPAFLSILKNIGWEDEQQHESVTTKKPKNKGELQRKLLGLKRKALAHRRKGEIEEAEELQMLAKEIEAQIQELEGHEQISESYYETLMNHEKLGIAKNAVDVGEKLSTVAVGQNKNIGSLLGSGRKESDKIALSSQSFGNLIPATSPPLLGALGSTGEAGLPGNMAENRVTTLVPSYQKSMKSIDFLTGDMRGSQFESIEEKTNKNPLEPRVQGKPSGPESPLVNIGNKEGKVNSGTPSEPLVRVGLQKEDIMENRKEMVNTDKKVHIHETNSAQRSTSRNNQDSLRQEVLARKRKAVALKREGKLAEAREELRQAKLLEKSLDEETPEPEAGGQDISKTVTTSPPIQQKELGGSNVARKPLSGRDRFKLQQESLSHKRQALKLRREGRLDEAEAEFELAKSLEAQLEELGSTSTAEAADDVVVEDLLDPQLFSALKAIGIEDASIAPQAPHKSRTTKVSPVKSETASQERTQLEERIKSEKVKAVNLKHAGKQAEALDALRRAKLLEKKLNSLASN